MHFICCNVNDRFVRKEILSDLGYAACPPHIERRLALIEQVVLRSKTQDGPIRLHTPRYKVFSSLSINKAVFGDNHDHISGDDPSSCCSRMRYNICILIEGIAHQNAKCPVAINGSDRCSKSQHHFLQALRSSVRESARPDSHNMVKGRFQGATRHLPPRSIGLDGRVRCSMISSYSTYLYLRPESDELWGRSNPQPQGAGQACRCGDSDPPVPPHP